MISISTVFWIMIIFLALIGSMRGWTKEIVATSGLVLSLFTINQFGTFLTGLVAGDVIDTEVARRQAFYWFTFIHLLIAFFSYQGPAFAGTRLADRLRIRDNLQDKFMGFLVGGVNGYLIVGSILAFLEFQLQGPATWVRLPPGVQYPFPLETITRATQLDSLMTNLPIPFLAPYLPFLVVIVFLFVLVVMI
jgi:uncharacterized membrane protein required for colicin V production